MAAARTFRVLPGFNLTLGYTLGYMSLLILIPLAAVFLKTTELTWGEFIDVVTAPQVVATYKLSFGASLLAAAINAVFGLMLAWALVRYSFPGKKIVDALVDLPFALPTAVAGIALTALYAKNGWLARCTPRTAGSASTWNPSASRSRSRRSACWWRWSSSACRLSYAPSSRFSRISIPSWKKPRPASVRNAGRSSVTSSCRSCCRH